MYNQLKALNESLSTCRVHKARVHKVRVHEARTDRPDIDSRDILTHSPFHEITGIGNFQPCGKNNNIINIPAIL